MSTEKRFKEILTTTKLEEAAKPFEAYAEGGSSNVYIYIDMLHGDIENDLKIIEWAKKEIFSKN